MSYQEEFFKALMEDRVVLKKLSNQDWVNTEHGEGRVFFRGRRSGSDSA